MFRFWYLPLYANGLSPVKAMRRFFMLFGEKLRSLRLAAGLSQKELASRVGVTMRSIQNYESNSRYPKDVEIVSRLAGALGTSITSLMETAAGPMAGVDALLLEVRALFAGGSLCDEDKEAVFQAITEAYRDAREKNRKYGSRG